MPTRRAFLSIGGAAALGLALPRAATGAAPAAPLPDATPQLTPDAALERLKAGNRAFLAGAAVPPAGSPSRRLEIARRQTPFAAYLSCSDSRVAPELLFGRGLGELFIVRNAGNSVDTAALGSLEYAVAELGVPLVVVMGHERCGAVAAAAAVVRDNATFPGAIGRMIEPIVPAVLAARGQPGDLVENAVRANVSRVVRQLRSASGPLLNEPQRQGRLKIVGACYDLDTGAVDFFDQPPA